MDMVPVCVGLDYHQVGVQVCVVDEAGSVPANRRCDNDWLAIKSLVDSHGQVKGVAIEACTGAADLAEELVVAAVANRWIRWLYHQMQPARLAV